MKRHPNQFAEELAMSRAASLIYRVIAYLVFLGIRMRIREHDLVELFGDQYGHRRTQLSMLFPWPGGELPRGMQPGRR